MPTYEFKCERCGNRHMKVMKMSEYDEYDKTCKMMYDNHPCGGKLIQIYGNDVAVHFKGTGWTPKFGPINKG